MEKHKPRIWLRVLSVFLVLGLLVGAAEVALRLIIPDVIATSVREKLNLTSDHPVDVSLGGSALLYALRGEVGQVSIAIDDAELVEGLRGNVSLHADAVPFDFTNGEIKGGTAELTIDSDQLPAAITLLTSGVADGAKVQGGELVVSRTMKLFGAEVPLSVSLALTTEGGDVSIEPKSVTAVGFDLSVDDLRAAAGGSLDDLLSPHIVCVRDRVPAGIELTGITLTSTGSVDLRVSLDPGIMSDPAQRELGSCE